ncbi:hypothetical protein MGLY_17630 [Neomoorella glycerini]|uniref:Uncharacterized protein n=1 Tax=Neomoorella glycerini TaxID=55779 RepID=A0A6I5ZRL8_9FIRM|nr:hypothetical protein [Moorella glycerini]QGP92388.1 hypothetical protein MGLY_17630 [Moorella glycerini]
MTARNVDLDKIQGVIDRCCKTEAECGTCSKAHCLIGFAQTVLAYARQKNTVRIPRGHELVPQDDFRVYYQQDLIAALVEVLLQCQNCRDNHEEECVINVTRRALELALLGENFEYEGSVSAYLMQVGRHNHDLGARLLQAYQERKKS